LDCFSNWLWNGLALSLDKEYNSSNVLLLNNCVLSSNSIAVMTISNGVEYLNIKESIVVNSEYVILDSFSSLLKTKFLVLIDQLFHLSLKSRLTFVLPSAVI